MECKKRQEKSKKMGPKKSKKGPGSLDADLIYRRRQSEPRCDRSTMALPDYRYLIVRANSRRLHLAFMPL